MGGESPLPVPDNGGSWGRMWIQEFPGAPPFPAWLWEQSPAPNPTIPGSFSWIQRAENIPGKPLPVLSHFPLLSPHSPGSTSQFCLEKPWNLCCASSRKLLPEFFWISSIHVYPGDKIHKGLDGTEGILGQKMEKLFHLLFHSLKISTENSSSCCRCFFWGLFSWINPFPLKKKPLGMSTPNSQTGFQLHPWEFGIL